MTPAKPRYTLPLAGKTYELEGSFALIEAAEHALNESVISIMLRCAQMPVNEMSRLIATLVTACGTKLTAAQVGETLWNEVGVSSDEYAMICLHVHAFLRITLVKPSERAETAKRMGELLGKPEKASRGKNTGGSA